MTFSDETVEAVAKAISANYWVENGTLLDAAKTSLAAVERSPEWQARQVGLGEEEVVEIMADAISVAAKIGALEYCKESKPEFYDDIMRDARAAYRALLAAGVISNGWHDIATIPTCDDLMWFCRGDTFDGPRAPAFDDADYWDYWCYAEPPALPTPPVTKEG